MAGLLNLSYRETSVRTHSFLGTFLSFYRVARRAHGWLGGIRVALSLWQEISRAEDRAKNPRPFPITPEPPIQRTVAPLSDLQVAEIERMADEGRAASDIAHIMGISPDRVRYRIARHRRKRPMLEYHPSGEAHDEGPL
jgi:DNA-directed RNA polymerase specialized sigma24 family protein